MLEQYAQAFGPFAAILVLGGALIACALRRAA